MEGIEETGRIGGGKGGGLRAMRLLGQPAIGPQGRAF